MCSIHIRSRIFRSPYRRRQPNANWQLTDDRAYKCHCTRDTKWEIRNKLFGVNLRLPDAKTPKHQRSRSIIIWIIVSRGSERRRPDSSNSPRRWWRHAIESLVRATGTCESVFAVARKCALHRTLCVFFFLLCMCAFVREWDAKHCRVGHAPQMSWASFKALWITAH